VDIPVDESGANQAARLEQEDKAAGMLFGRLGDAQVLQVQELNTVREIFDHFDQIYGTQNNGDAFSVQAQLDAMQYNVKLDPIKFFVEFDNLIQKLVSLNVIVTDACYILFLTQWEEFVKRVEDFYKFKVLQVTMFVIK